MSLKDQNAEQFLTLSIVKDVLEGKNTVLALTKYFHSWQLQLALGASNSIAFESAFYIAIEQPSMLFWRKVRIKLFVAYCNDETSHYFWKNYLYKCVWRGFKGFWTVHVILNITSDQHYNTFWTNVRIRLVFREKIVKEELRNSLDSPFVGAHQHYSSRLFKCRLPLWL